MVRSSILSGLSACASLALVSAAEAQSASPTGASPVDPYTRLSLFGAAFDGTDAALPAAQGRPAEKRTAMAFLPGRGVIAWDVTGKTDEEAREAQVEAMGLADARAVQKEIDAAAAQRPAAVTGSAARLNLASAAPPPRESPATFARATTARGGGLPGVRSDETVRGKPRLYAFAAASGRGVGFNMLHEAGGWSSGGLTTDRDGGYSGQRQAGLAWRKGVVQTSLSYVQQKDKGRMLGMPSDKDQRVMLTATLPPQAILGLFAKPN